MKKELLNLNIDPQCTYCEHGKISPDGEHILCKKKGIMERYAHCKKFRYDPLKREPAKKPKLPEFSPEEFEL